MVTDAIQQNNDPSTNIPQSNSGEKWKELASTIWKEIKTLKFGSGFKKYNEKPIEQQCIDNISQLQDSLYFLYVKKKLVTIIFVTKNRRYKIYYQTA